MKNFVSNVIARLVCAAILAGAPILCTTLSGTDLTTLPAWALIIGALILVFGFCLGWLVRGFLIWGLSVNSNKLSKRELAEQCRKAIIEAPENYKRLLKAAATVEGSVYCRVDDWNTRWEGERDFLCQFLDVEIVEGGRINLFPKEDFLRFYESNADLFDVISDKSIQDRAMNDPSRSNVRYGYDFDGLTWWWYPAKKRR